MRYYETLYLINPNLADEDYKDVVTKFNDLVEKNKGVIVKIDEWGKKTLAYEVKKFDKGYYVLLNYCGEPDLITALKREFNLDERILKYQTIKLSDSADPEKLKQDAEVVREKVGEEVTLKEGEELETSSEAISEKEGENGLQ